MITFLWIAGIVGFLVWIAKASGTENSSTRASSFNTEMFNSDSISSTSLLNDSNIEIQHSCPWCGMSGCNGLATCLSSSNPMSFQYDNHLHHNLEDIHSNLSCGCSHICTCSNSISNSLMCGCSGICTCSSSSMFDDSFNSISSHSSFDD